MKFYMEVIELAKREYHLIVDLVRRTMGDKLAEECYNAVFDEDIERYMYGVFDGNELIACSGYCFYGIKAYISWTVVNVSYRRYGWGQELLNKVLENLKNFSQIYVETYCRNDFLPAIKFYESLGFVIYRFKTGSKNWPVVYLCKES